MRGQFAVMARMPSSAMFRQWLTFSSLMTLAQCPRDKAVSPDVVTLVFVKSRACKYLLLMLIATMLLSEMR